VCARSWRLGPGAEWRNTKLAPDIVCSPIRAVGPAQENLLDWGAGCDEFHMPSSRGARACRGFPVPVGALLSQRRLATPPRGGPPGCGDLRATFLTEDGPQTGIRQHYITVPPTAIPHRRPIVRLRLSSSLTEIHRASRSPAHRACVLVVVPLWPNSAPGLQRLQRLQAPAT